MKKGLFYILILLLSIDLFGQTMPTVSQYDIMPLQFNPGSTGNMDALAVGLKFRKHWTGIDGSPSTQVFCAHAPLKNPKVALGLLLENENVGITNYTGIFLNYAYRIPLNSGNLSFGIKGGITAGSQSSVTLRDGSDPAFSSNTSKFMVPNFGFGAYYYSKKLWAGFSIPRFFGFESTTSGSYKMTHNVSRYEYFITGGGKLNFSSSIAVEPSALVVLSSVLKPVITINCIGVFRNTFKGGVGFRTNDAVIIDLGYNLNRQLAIVYCYDINIGKLSKYTSGSHEINLQYKFGYTVNTSSPRHF
jgi:type IX secretion system PorP/SprF family membrane protein